MTDEAFLSAFESGTLPRAHFDHRGHLRAAWLYLERHPLPEAAARCAATIRAYAIGQGDHEKFHHTLTLAFMHIVAERRHAHPAADFDTFLAAAPELLTGARALIARHYSPARLRTPEARHGFVPPDRAPLP
jgi:hypothetical protein